MLNTHTPTAGSPPKRNTLVGTPTNVSEPAFEYLLSSMLHWVEQECERNYKKQQMKEIKTKLQEANKEETIANIESEEKKKNEIAQMEGERMVMIAENAAAKMERMGYDVGYRLSERLAQSKSMTPVTQNNKKPTPAMVQLEAVKFICKEFWTETFQKQMDKLQTNHRGVFVLKDLQFKWLKRLPGDVELARIMAIKILAFPCGLIRGALANLGILAVVSCDFLADGKNMSACSFNIKVKV
jgi:hypothetical protein|eukprot:scaffold1222_cov260-Chaetoceros_neogracile.AAC.14